MAGEVPERLFSLSLYTSRETSYSFQNTEVSWSPPLTRPPKSSGRSARFRLRARSALVFSHPPLLSVFFTRLPRSFVSVSFARLQSEEHRGTAHAVNRVYRASETSRIETMKNSSDRDYIFDELNRDNQARINEN